MSNRIETLRALADMLENHPEVETPNIDAWGTEDINLIRFQLTSHGEDATASAAAIMKAIPGAFTKSYSDDYLTLVGKLAGVSVEIRTMRADVCIARQVGTKAVKQRDPEALKLVPEIEVEVPVYEYDCKPILAKAVA